MSTETPIQEFARNHVWAGDGHPAEVWRFDGEWVMIHRHNSPDEAAPHLVIESCDHNSMLVMTGMAAEIKDDLPTDNVQRVRIFVYMDRGSMDYKTAFEMGGEIIEGPNVFGGVFTELLELAISKRDMIMVLKELWERMNDEWQGDQ